MPVITWCSGSQTVCERYWKQPDADGNERFHPVSGALAAVKLHRRAQLVQFSVNAFRMDISHVGHDPLDIPRCLRSKQTYLKVLDFKEQLDYNQEHIMLPAPKAAPNTVATAVAKARRELLHQVVHHLTITVHCEACQRTHLCYVICMFYMHKCVICHPVFHCAWCCVTCLSFLRSSHVAHCKPMEFRHIQASQWPGLARGCVMCISSLLGLLIDHLGMCQNCP